MSRTGITLLSPGQREISPSGPPRGAGEESADHERPRYHRRRRRCPRNVPPRQVRPGDKRSEEHTSELQSLMRISYAVFCLKKKTQQNTHTMIAPLITNLHKTSEH